MKESGIKREYCRGRPHERLTSPAVVFILNTHQPHRAAGHTPRQGGAIKCCISTITRC